MKKTALILLLAVIIVPFASCKSKKLPVKDVLITKADGTTLTVKAEIAEKEEERNHGFMERKNIPDGTGMLFIFDRDQILSFWMKNTPHPLSIAYIDYNGKIRNIYDMTPFSLTPIKSTSSCRYALEVPQGWFDKNNVNVGDKVSW
ncbi:MAG: DUF192 domain-containing protein [Treponema sp.]|nr:DUF192 domain-containing protein [Treponema sp.]